MPSPFPGMNPYLENPDFWSGVHGRLIVAIANFLSPQLRPKYFVAIEERIYETIGDDRLLVGIPDVVVQRSQIDTIPTSNIAVAIPTKQPKTVKVPTSEIVKERYLEVRKVATKEAVTAMEILSPKNKRTGEGRNAYETKRNRVLKSATHLIEIDLLRTGEAMPILGNTIQTDYRILVSRSEFRPQADLYDFNLKDVIPAFPLPLLASDNEPLIDLQALLNQLYDQASYDLVIDYNQEPIPALSQSDAAWTDTLLHEKGLR